MLNTILIIIILALMVFAVVWYISKTNTTDIKEEYDNFKSIQSLSKLTLETFASTLRRSMNEQNLSEEEYKKTSAIKEEIKYSIRMAPLGDKQAKALVLSFTKDILEDYKIGNINIQNMKMVIPFDEPERMKSRDRFEFLVFLWLREGKKGFSNNFIRYNLHLPTYTPYGNEYVVTEDMIKEVFFDYMSHNYSNVTYMDKINYIAQRTYEDTYGLGAADLLLETDVDEVQGGVSGIPANSYEIQIEDMENVSYSFESVWIVFKGLNIHIKATTFGTQKELVRVCRNIYKYNAPKNLSKKDPGIIGSMKNGNRIVVASPEFSDSYLFIARKFDSTPSLSPEKLLGEKV